MLKFKLINTLEIKNKKIEKKFFKDREQKMSVKHYDKSALIFYSLPFYLFDYIISLFTLLVSYVYF